MLRIALTLIAIAAATPVLAQSYPSESVPDVPNAVAEPFAGNWAMGMAGRSEPLHPCSAPVAISVVDGATIHFLTNDGGDTNFALSEDNGATVWTPPDNAALIAVWTGADSFNLHSPGMDGGTDWEFPFVMTRCP